VALLPKAADARTYLGRLEMASRHYPEALRDFGEALKLDPTASFALMSAGQAHAAMGNDAAAEPLFRRALETDAKDADAANQLGLLLVRQNHPDEARQCFEQAIAAQRDHVWAINNLGVLYMQIQKVNDAIAAFRYGIEVVPDEETSYLNLARVYARAGDRAKAREILRQLMARKPSSAAGAKALHELGE
jgi:superkiller protein 3